MYCLDTNVLINSWHFWYTPENHPTFWDGLESLANKGQLIIPEQVLEELSEQSDELYEWCKKRRQLLCYQATNASESAYKNLANKYPSLIGAVGLNKNYADLYVVAVAAAVNGTVVTTEKHDATTNIRKYKIPHVCKENGVAFIQPYTLVRLLGWVFKHS